MEYRITDLLDEMQEISVSVEENNRVDCDRIKNLTLQRVRAFRRGGKSRFGGFSIKAALVAAAILCLSATVLAAVGDGIPNLFETASEPTDPFDSGVYVGSVSKSYEAGSYVVHLTAEAVRPSGLTLICHEWGTQLKNGTLRVDGGYWLEKWNGMSYERYKPEVTVTDGLSVEICPGDEYRWTINWEKYYGHLAPGYYRIGRTLLHCDGALAESETKVYAKFAVLEADIRHVYDRYEAELQELMTGETHHLTWQVFPKESAYDSYTMELWHAGADYLACLRYLDAEGKLLSHSGMLFANGKGYRLTWEDGDVTGAVVEYKEDETVVPELFCYWEAFLKVSDAGIKSAEAKTDLLILQEERYETRAELENGRIARVICSRLEGSECVTDSILTVQDTDLRAIKQTILEQIPKN